MPLRKLKEASIANIDADVKQDEVWSLYRDEAKEDRRCSGPVAYGYSILSGEVVDCDGMGCSMEDEFMEYED